MQIILIQLLNWTALVLILVGIPAITSLQFGSLQLGSVPIARQLILGGCTLSVALNFLGAVWLAKGKRARNLCRNWAFVMAALLLVHVLLFKGYIHFDWLKESLLWLRDHLHRP